MILDVQGDKRFLAKPFLDPVIATLCYLVITSYLIFTLWPLVFHSVFFQANIVNNSSLRLTGLYNGIVYSAIFSSAFFFVSSFCNPDVNEDLAHNRHYVFFKNHSWLLLLLLIFLFAFLFSIFYTIQDDPANGGCYILHCVPVENRPIQGTDISFFPFGFNSLILIVFYYICFHCSSLKWIQICNKVLQKCFWTRLRPGINS
jgi:magnesium-transporting ATPase (P-type)